MGRYLTGMFFRLCVLIVLSSLIIILPAHLIIIPPVQCASLSSHLIIILLLFSCAELDEVTVQLFKQSNKRTFGNLTKVSFVLKCSLEPFLQMSWPYLK